MKHLGEGFSHAFDRICAAERGINPIERRISGSAHSLWVVSDQREAARRTQITQGSSPSARKHFRGLADLDDRESIKSAQMSAEALGINPEER